MEEVGKQPSVRDSGQDLLANVHLGVLKLSLGPSEILLESLDEFQSLPDVGLQTAVLQRTGDYLFFGVFLKRLIEI